MNSKIVIVGVALLTIGVIAFYPWLKGNVAMAKWPDQAVVSDPVTTMIKPVSPSTQAEQRAEIEVVFVLDTTSSMNGLIEAAKENIWSVASTLASGQPAPQVKMGLVAFRDRGDQYLTKVVDLSKDLDSMYATLMDFEAAGGGDGPESVNKALLDAVQEISWGQAEEHFSGQTGNNVYRAIFLVGDAPPHMDYAGEMQYPDIISLAADKGIVVNTIQAGNDPQTSQVWQRIASLNQGEFLQVASAGDAIAVTTPFDSPLAALSKALDDTRLFFGTREKRNELARKIAATKALQNRSSAAALAKRARYNISAAGEANLLGDSELVDAVASGRVGLDELSPAELPKAMQSLSSNEQKALLKQKAGQRQELRSQIRDLTEQRQHYIEEQLKASAGAEDSLNHKLHRTLKAQAADKGIIYEAMPVY